MLPLILLLIHLLLSGALKDFPTDADIRHTEGVDLVPASIELSGLKVTVVNTMSRKTSLRDYLNSVRGQYNVILLVCCPLVIAEKPSVAMPLSKVLGATTRRLDLL